MWRHIKRTLFGFALLAVVVSAAGLVYARASGSKLLSVQSGSMVPTFHKGDLVTVTRVSPYDLKRGDVVTFINPADDSQTITHRIVEKNSHGIITKGDANPVPDRPILPSTVIGKVKNSVPYVGYGLDFLRSPIGLILLMYIPALLIILHELKLLAAYYRSRVPYRVPGRGEEEISVKPLILFVAFAITGMLIFKVVPAFAALNSTASLTGNTISATSSTTPPPETGGILLAELEMRCSFNNSATVNTVPYIQLYNNSNQTVNLAGWHIDDNTGTIYTLPANASVAPGHRYPINLINQPLAEPQGLQYGGDRLTLFDGSNSNIDSLSWMSDTTVFNPSVQSVTAGSDMLRTPVTTDTNVATDWQLTQRPCR